jgi:hypothetical protein
MSPVTSPSLLADFEQGRIDPAGFRHADHVRVAWELLCDGPLPRAMERMAEGLRRLTAIAGKPERYHETITWAWVLLVADRIARRGRRESFAAFAAANPDLLDSRLLWAHYRDETLASPEARQAFRMPDRRDAAGEPPTAS